GEANEGDVGNAFEFEHQLLLLTGLAEQREARGLATAGGECRVAETTTATGSSNVTGACPHKVRQHLTLAVLDDRAFGHQQHEALTVRAHLEAAHPGSPRRGACVGRAVEVQQCCRLRVDFEDDVTAVAAVAAIRAAEWLELLPAHRGHPSS